MDTLSRHLPFFLGWQTLVGIGVWQGFLPTAAIFAQDALSVQKALAEAKKVGF